MGHTICPFEDANRISKQIFRLIERLDAKSKDDFIIEGIEKDFGISYKVSEAQLRKWKEKKSNLKPR